MKRFGKALNKDVICFNYICRKIPELSIDKSKAGSLNYKVDKGFKLN